MKQMWYMPLALACALVVQVVLPAAPALASELERLGETYQVAVQAYESAVVEREQNAGEIAAVETELAETQQSLDSVHEKLDDTAVSLYKENDGSRSLLNLILDSTSFSDAVQRYDTYVRIEQYYADRARELIDARDELSARRSQLEARKAEIEERVTQAKQAAEEAERALHEARHSDGDEYHQVQGNSSNCGATAFTVGVNILLHEKRFTDNVEVWKGAGFKGDSTNNLALRGKAWLLANELGDVIDIEEVPGDITTPDALRDALEGGKVVVISSGAESRFLRNSVAGAAGSGAAGAASADAASAVGSVGSAASAGAAASASAGSASAGSAAAAEGADGQPAVTTRDFAKFPDGHWIVFYYCEDGFFYANDSSVTADKGAGVVYSTEELDQWLKGRSTHFATVMCKR